MMIATRFIKLLMRKLPEIQLFANKLRTQSQQLSVNLNEYGAENSN